MNKQLEYWEKQNKKLPLEKTNESFNTCWICGKLYDNKKGVSSHLRQIHNIVYKNYYDQLYKTSDEGKCFICHKPTTWKNAQYKQYCSCICSNHDERIQEIIRQKNKNKSAISIEKRKKTTYQKYGVEHYCQTDLCKLERITYYIKKQGNKGGFANKQLRDKAIQIGTQNMYKGVYEKLSSSILFKPMFTFEEYKGTKNFEYNWLCKKCNNIFQYPYINGCFPRCPKCFPRNYTIQSNEILKFLDNNQIYNIKNNRTQIKPFELDYYLPDNNLAIEYNGLYWHSELNGKKEKNYHLQKTKLCEAKNIKLIQIFEDEWVFKNLIVKTRLKHILGLVKRNIYARKCVIKEIDNKLKNIFLNKYHIQGEDKAIINLGCFYQTRLVAVMTFSKLRIALGQTHKEDSWELSRYCTIGSFNIIGGAGKLLKHFERTYNPLQLVTYADRRWSQGNLYNKLGFKLDHISSPNYWYIQKYKQFNQRIHRFNFRKSILKKKLEKFDPNLTEWENMQINGYDRIWDCGNLVFVKEYERKI